MKAIESLISQKLCLLDCKFNSYSDIQNVYCPIHNEDEQKDLEYKPQLEGINTNIAVCRFGTGSWDRCAAQKLVCPIRYHPNEEECSRNWSDDLLFFLGYIPINDINIKYYLTKDTSNTEYNEYCLKNNKIWDAKRWILLDDQLWECGNCTYAQNELGASCKICKNPSPNNPWYLRIEMNENKLEQHEDCKYDYDSSSSAYKNVSKPSFGEFIDKDYISVLATNELKASYFESQQTQYHKFYGDIDSKDLNETNKWFEKILKEETPNCEL